VKLGFTLLTAHLDVAVPPDEAALSGAAKR
jgi:hypothetical protein